MKLRKLLSILLTVVMCAGMLAVPAYAEQSVTGFSHSHPVCGESCTHETPHETVEYTPILQWINDNMSNFKPDNTGGEEKYYGRITANTNLVLTEDIEFPLSIRVENPSDSPVTINLCLNGHVADINGITADTTRNTNKASVTLNLCDCNGSKGEHKFSVDADGKWSYDKDNGTETVYGGVITGAVEGYSAFSGDEKPAVINFYGGSLVGNNTSSSVISVHNPGGQFNMYGGRIAHNTISNNIVHIANCDFNMSGGEIVNNQTTFKGAVAVYAAENSENPRYGNVSLSGDIKIADNIKIDLTYPVNTPADMYFNGKNAKITGISSLSEDARIGICMEEAGVFSNVGAKFIDRFTSNNAAHYIDIDGDGMRLCRMDTSMFPTADIFAVTPGIPGAHKLYYGGYIWDAIGHDGVRVASSKGDAAFILGGDLMNTWTVTKFSDSGNEYKGSELQKVIDEMLDKFSNAEKGAVKPKTLTNIDDGGEVANYIGGEDVENAYLWPLTAREAGALYGNFRGTKLWWVGSPGADGRAMAADDSTYKHEFEPTATTGNEGASDYITARPGFNIDLSKVLFTSAAVGGKPDGITAPQKTVNNEWKLTVLDESKAEFSAKVVRVNKENYVQYKNAAFDENDYISLLVKNRSGIAYYGRLFKPEAAEGTKKLDLSALSISGDDEIYIFNEAYNGDKKTDYASPLIPVKLNDRATPVISEIPEASKLKRGKALSESELTGGVALNIFGEPMHGKFSWKSPDKIMASKGSFTETIVFTPVDVENYNTAEAQFSVRVSSSSTGSIKYLVRYESNGGTDVKAVNVNRNSKLNEPDEPTREGFVFGGWYEDKKLETPFDFETRIMKDYVLHAKWTDNRFTDVKESDWFYDAVMKAMEGELMIGISDTEFAPEMSLTRAMFVTILHRAEGEPEEGTVKFEDVPKNSYYEKAVAWASKHGIVLGVSETKFNPDTEITREQMCAILYRYAKYSDYDVSAGEDINILSFEDAEDISEYAVEAVQWAAAEEILHIEGDALRPRKDATRAEAAWAIIGLMERIFRASYE